MYEGTAGHPTTSGTPGFRSSTNRGRRDARTRGSSILAASVAMLLVGCAHTGPLKPVSSTVAPVLKDSTVHEPRGGTHVIQTWQPMFGDTIIGLIPGTGDSTRRYLGRLRDGYTADTLNLFLLGDNRPGWRAVRLAPEYAAIQQTVSLNPVKVVRGLVTIPWAVVKGLWPDLALLRDIPDKVRNMPHWSRETQVMNAMLGKLDSLRAHGQSVTAVLNTGDLVDDGRVPAHWERFLRITQPLYTRVPYFPSAGNHERTDDPLGIANWRTATGLPASGDRLYYCFDTADGWLRVIALDTNPIFDPGKLWTREVQVKYSEEEFAWLVARVKEHRGPVIIMMHNPPFSSGFHREEWQRDSVLSNRRERMVRALHETGISILATGHEHDYQRALLTWPDAVLISLGLGGGGAPLNALPPSPEVARRFSEYQVAGATVKPENVFSAQVYHFVHLRLWFGGGDFYAYAVDKQGKATQIDKVSVDLKRYGIPKIDQHKIPIPPAKGPVEPASETEKAAPKVAGKVDSTTSSKRILSKKVPTRAKADSLRNKRAKAASGR
jgi:hypothetical protein